MRWNKPVHPVSHFANELSPVSIFSPESLECWCSCCVAALRVPHELIVGLSNVLGSLNEVDKVDAAFLGLRLLKQLFPRVLLVEVDELKVFEGDLVLLDWVVAIEHGKHVVTFLNLGLVHGE